MKMNSLPTVIIKNQKYVLVKDRILYFNETYQNWCITTERKTEWTMEVICATIYPDVDKPTRMFTWRSQATWGDGYINKTSALENAETSAVGRALAMMGIWVIDSIASVDEIKKTEVVKPAEELKCSVCWEAVNAAVSKYSQDKFWSVKCMSCQKK